MLCSAVHSEVVLPEVISDYRNSQIPLRTFPFTSELSMPSFFKFLCKKICYYFQTLSFIFNSRYMYTVKLYESLVTKLKKIKNI